MSQWETLNRDRMELTYDVLHGFIEMGSPTGALLQERMQINALVDTIYRHRLRLCNRAGPDFEDKDLEEIVSAYDKMNYLVARLMYEQGKLEAQK